MDFADQENFMRQPGRICTIWHGFIRQPMQKFLQMFKKVNFLPIQKLIVVFVILKTTFKKN